MVIENHFLYKLTIDRRELYMIKLYYRGKLWIKINLLNLAIFQKTCV